ncbi:MAG: 50S ribosome-binding GTPase [Candidatus Bathyarchaeota archaeon]|nr:50S ribosome-binding GTPase [Candidatus Bathyarchaeota archaeon]
MPEEVKLKERLTGKAILCMLKTSAQDHTIFRIKMDELKALVNALGIEVIDEVIQSKYHSSEATCIGKGKVKELRKKIEKHGVSLVVFYNLLKSSQKLALIQGVGCDVIDRYELTLEIFEQMASDNLSKLQIESAKLEKLTPFYKLSANANFANDRPFFHSGGEYGFRAQIRELTRRKAGIRKEIEQLVIEKRKQIASRKKLGFPTICIAGYYNAGKTSLFNTLTGDHKPVSARPFTTLSSKYQKRYINPETSVLFIDTIGFVIDLDHRLIKSFQINFEDIRNAEVVILLFDISDPATLLKLKLKEGLSLLQDIGVNLRRVLLVFNQIDKAPDSINTINEELSLGMFDIPWMAVSAKQHTNMNELLNLIAVKVKELKETPINEEPIHEPKQTNPEELEESVEETTEDSKEELES